MSEANSNPRGVASDAEGEVVVRLEWQRPALKRLDLRDAEFNFVGIVEDGGAKFS